jgi:hypothetical protein
MKKKIISIIIVGMFLLTNLTIFLAAGMKTFSKNYNEVNNPAENTYSNSIGEVELHVHISEPTKKIDINLNIEEDDIISPGVYTFTYRVIFHELPEDYSIKHIYWDVNLVKDFKHEVNENNHGDPIEYSYYDVPPDTIEKTLDITIAKKPIFLVIRIEASINGSVYLNGYNLFPLDTSMSEWAYPLVIKTKPLNTKFHFLTSLGQFPFLRKLIQKLSAF